MRDPGLPVPGPGFAPGTRLRPQDARGHACFQEWCRPAPRKRVTGRPVHASDHANLQEVFFGAGRVNADIWVSAMVLTRRSRP